MPSHAFSEIRAILQRPTTIARLTLSPNYHEHTRPELLAQLARSFECGTLIHEA